MKDDFVLGIYEEKVSKELLFKLKALFLDNSGNTKVIMRVLDSHGYQITSMELKNLKIQLSLNLMLQIHEII